MSTSDLMVTLVGWVGTEPRHYTGAGSTPFTSFRMANTRRYFDRASNAWADGRTEWFTVKVWRQSALNVATSLRKGDPVLVHGRLATEQWDSPEGPRTSLVLEALAIGPDLTYGRTTFARTVQVSAPTGGAEAVDDGTVTGARTAGATAGRSTMDDGDDPWAAEFAVPDELGTLDRPETDGSDGSDRSDGPDGVDASTGGTGGADVADRPDGPPDGAPHPHGGAGGRGRARRTRVEA